jgi:glyoxalase family protein
LKADIAGIHHVTAIAGDPQRNLDFYTGVLGLRLVKRTVNYDDPGTYHFYYGDGMGRPGTILTFFPWPGAPQGRRGAGQTTAIALSVPAGAMEYWQERLRASGTVMDRLARRFDEEVLTFFDPDGLQLELVAHPEEEGRPGWLEGPVPPERAIRGIRGVTLTEADYTRTAEMLNGVLGFRAAKEQGNRVRFITRQGGMGAALDVLSLPEEPHGRILAGTVHHVAWRAPDDGAQQAWRDELVRLRHNVSSVMDRQYFHSIYFREPGGVLFEIATDPPGFTTDETPERLGSGLMLPSWLEPQRARIEEALPPVRLPVEKQEVSA